MTVCKCEIVAKLTAILQDREIKYFDRDVFSLAIAAGRINYLTRGMRARGAQFPKEP